MLNAIQQGIVLDSTKKRLTDLEARQKQLTIEIAEEQIRKPILTREQIMYGICRFRKLDLTTTKGRQALIDGFVNSIYLYDDYAIITCNYKDGTMKIILDDVAKSGLGYLVKGQKNKPEQECSGVSVFVGQKYCLAYLHYPTSCSGNYIPQPLSHETLERFLYSDDLEFFKSSAIGGNGDKLRRRIPCICAIAIP